MDLDIKYAGWIASIHPGHSGMDTEQKLLDTFRKVFR